MALQNKKMAAGHHCTPPPFPILLLSDATTKACWSIVSEEHPDFK